MSFHQALFDKWLKGTRLVGRVTSVQFLAPDVALMHVLGDHHAGKDDALAGSRLDSDARRDSAEWRVEAGRFSKYEASINGPWPRVSVGWTITDWLWKFQRRKSEMSV